MIFSHSLRAHPPKLKKSKNNGAVVKYNLAIIQSNLKKTALLEVLLLL